MATIIRDDGVSEVAAVAAPGTLLLDPGDLAQATGWRLEPEGLCRGDVCVPTRSHPDLVVSERVDLRVFATALGRPFAFDEETQTAALGAPGEEIDGDGDLAGLVLRDADGAEYTWSRIGRKKKLLVAWASW